MSLGTVPGKVVRGRRTATTAAGQPTLVDTGRSGEEESAGSHDLENKRYFFKSWVVPFNDGNRALEVARADWMTPPRFNFVNIGARNCAGWVQKIAAIAGITPTTISARIGFPVPVWEVQDGAELKTETEMWENRNSAG